LHDILREWSEFVVNERHVLDYQLPLLSPNAIVSTPADVQDPVVATQILRSNVARVKSNIAVLRALPAADLVRTKKEALSLYDLDSRIDDLLRYRLDPLVHRIVASGLLTDRPSTIRFLETQLAYDERQLDAQKQAADAFRQALEMYSNGRTAPIPEGTDGRSAGTQSRSDVTAETVMPQLSESFMDRLIQITSNSVDLTYRQRLAEDYRDTLINVVPLGLGPRCKSRQRQDRSGDRRSSTHGHARRGPQPGRATPRDLCRALP
jgi:hypothetical protein